MVTTYRLQANELSPAVLDSIKAAFKDKTIEIIVTDELDETAYLLAKEANRKHLFESIKELEEGKGIEITVQELLEKYSTGK